MNHSKPMVKLAGLFERTSKSGNRYFSGLLGNARVLIFTNADHSPNDPKSPTHNLMVQERDDSPPEAARPAATVQTSSPPPARADRDFRRNGDGSENEEWTCDASVRRHRNPNFRRAAPPDRASSSASDDLGF